MSVKFADVAEQYRKNKDLKKEDVKKLLEWLDSQPHLPKITELDAIIFLYSCYCSNEATKTCIDNYFTVRTHCPEFFANRNPASAEIQTNMKAVHVTPLPNLTPEGYCIIYCRLKNTNPEVFNFNSCLKLFDMMSSLYLREMGALQGHIIIYDMGGLQLGHVLRLGPLSLKKFLFYLQDALPFRLKGFTFLNAGPLIDKILALIKPFMKKELLDMLAVHQSDTEAIFESIPKANLPHECGGTLGPITEIHENWIKRLEANAKYFADEEKMVVDESKRPGKPKNAGELFGVEGTFKKLDID